MPYEVDMRRCYTSCGIDVQNTFAAMLLTVCQLIIAPYLPNIHKAHLGEADSYAICTLGHLYLSSPLQLAGKIQHETKSETVFWLAQRLLINCHANKYNSCRCCFIFGIFLLLIAGPLW